MPPAYFAGNGLVWSSRQPPPRERRHRSGLGTACGHDQVPLRPHGVHAFMGCLRLGVRRHEHNAHDLSAAGGIPISADASISQPHVDVYANPPVTPIFLAAYSASCRALATWVLPSGAVSARALASRPMPYTMHCAWIVSRRARRRLIASLRQLIADRVTERVGKAMLLVGDALRGAIAMGTRASRKRRATDSAPMRTTWGIGCTVRENTICEGEVWRLPEGLQARHVGTLQEGVDNSGATVSKQEGDSNCKGPAHKPSGRSTSTTKFPAQGFQADEDICLWDETFFCES